MLTAEQKGVHIPPSSWCVRGASATQELSGRCFLAVQPLSQGCACPVTPHHVPGDSEPGPRGRQRSPDPEVTQK